MFRSKLGRMEIDIKEIEEEWERIESKVKKTIRKTEKELKEETKKKGGWWDEE